MATVKPLNYTAAQTSAIVARYIAGGVGTSSADFDARDEIVKELALEFRGDVKQVRSIRSKLTREKREDGTQVYIARSTVSGVTGKTPAKKDVMASLLILAAGDTSGVSKSPLNATSIEKMNKPEIDILAMQFDALHAEIAEQNGIIASYQAEFGDLPEVVEDENDSQVGETS